MNTPETTAGAGDRLDAKIRELADYVRSLGRVLIAYSGGVDSTFLAAVAGRAMGDKVLAITVKVIACPERMLQYAASVARTLGVRHRFLELDQLSIPGFCENTPERCYHCKVAILTALRGIAAEEGIEHVLDGGNADDLGDYRPGHKAVEEQGILSPLQAFGWSKADIREASRRFGLPTADMPSYACLASRIPAGTVITAENLMQVDAVEEYLQENGIMNCRARHHGPIVRIEVSEADLGRLADRGFREGVVRKAKDAGFRFVALDLEPYSTGRLNDPSAAASS